MINREKHSTPRERYIAPGITVETLRLESLLLAGSNTETIDDDGNEYPWDNN